MKRIGYIIRSYPRLSQTFIVNEILALEELGQQLHLFPIADPREPIVQAQVAAVRAPVDYLEQATRRGRAAILAEHLRAALESPARYLRTLRYVARRKDLDEGYTTASRYECFAQAVYLARLLRREARAGRPIAHLHAHFAHDPALVALLAQMLTGISFSFTAHARDLVQIPPRALVERIERATVMLTCSGTNVDYVDEVVPEPLRAKVRLIHHGVNLDGFQPAIGRHGDGATGRALVTVSPRRPVAPSELDEGQYPLILSVGRLVEKKGFPDLIAACARLKAAGRRFRCAIYGEGPLEGELAALVERLGLADCVTLPGACSQRELIPVFQRADVFALAPFVTEDGDRDGIPNVLVEAMACGLPVVSTAVAGIPELVRPGDPSTHSTSSGQAGSGQGNGLLVAPRDADGLAAALAALLDDPARRAEMGAAARRTVVERFDLRAAARQIAALFEQATVDNERQAFLGGPAGERPATDGLAARR
ncbi:MAG TPA: glycosyltransferase [Roseiflexaceae bacterium]